jgi:uncharacterized protein YbgA (DUF1722 family)/uncharacterized protein YbbK (DUF523 family)
MEARPNVVVSKCLGFAACRYNGQMLSSELVEKLRPHVDFIPVCAEFEIGLGVPRDPIRLVQENGVVRLMQPASGRDVSDEMNKFSEDFLSSLSEVDGFILKNRSPSCGIKDVKVYSSIQDGASIRRDAGFFGGSVLRKYGAHAVEDEGRLKDDGIREHFLTKLYTLARFRSVRSMANLVRFQTENKLLLMAYNQTGMRTLGRIVANKEKKTLEDVMGEYRIGLQNAFLRAPRRSSAVNVLMHAFGYFKDRLNEKEKKFFLKSLEDYRKGTVPLSSILTMLRMWIIRFDEAYLGTQQFFSPYPKELEAAKEDIFT